MNQQKGVVMGQASNQAGAFELKKLSAEGVTAALEKAQRYRLLNEPQEAESICLDILDVPSASPAAQAQARVLLILALSDQLPEDLSCYDEAMQVISQLGDYERPYYEGILCERRAKAHHRSTALFAKNIAHDWFRRAMNHFETAMSSPARPPGNEDAILRWNTCARVLMRHPELEPGVEERGDETFLE
jgi:hypothetical protein